MLTIEYLGELVEKYKSELQVQVREFAIGNKFLNFNIRPAIMGVVNLSPDSWYRESVCLTTERAIQRGKILYDQGADIIDIGAESTILTASRVSASLQMGKLLPVVRELSKLNIPVSVESYSVEVIEEALKSGAKVINMTTAEDTEIVYRYAADYDAGVIICYIEGKNVREVADFDLESDPVSKMKEYFSKEIEKAQKVNLTKLFIDPGLGFYYRNLQDSAKRVRHQIYVFLNSFRLRSLGFPICNALPHAFEYFAEEVRTAEPFFAVLASLGKTDLFRTHEVPKVKAVLDTLAVF